uniref:Uncharacterized protein n=1 Tax=Rhizophora mucronata TaxID=61149 RepID=A0A2P2PAM3_RHIMU
MMGLNDHQKVFKMNIIQCVRRQYSSKLTGPTSQLIWNLVFGCPCLPPKKHRKKKKCLSLLLHAQWKG